MMEGWKNKILNFEVKPPPGAWNKIVTALDDSHLSDQFPGILHDMAVTPPSSAWNGISSELNEKLAPARVTRKIPVYVRYAAAAAVLLLIIFSTTRYFRNMNSEKPGITPVSESVNPAVTPGKEIQNRPDEQDRLDNLALEESKQTFATLDLSAGNRKRITSYEHFIHPVDANLETLAVEPQNTYRELDHAVMRGSVETIPSSRSTLASRYIMLMTPDGNIIRMSKKLGDLVCCVSGEEQDEDCKDQLNKWRSKILSSPGSAGNFMDILNLVNSLQAGNH